MKSRNYKILLDENWSLEELTEFSRLYFQNYSFIYCLETNAVPHASDRIGVVLKDYELRDGLSYVNVYDIFKSHIESEDKPKIKSLQYNSPGWIELVLNPEAALQVAKAIAIYIGSITATGGTVLVAYKKLHKIYIDLKHQREKAKNNSLKLEKEKIILVNKLHLELAKGLGYESIEELDKMTGDIEETSKLLMAHYRRISKMAKFVESRKAIFPLNLV